MFELLGRPARRLSVLVVAGLVAVLLPSGLAAARVTGRTASASTADVKVRTVGPATAAAALAVDIPSTTTATTPPVTGTGPPTTTAGSVVTTPPTTRGPTTAPTTVVSPPPVTSPVDPAPNGTGTWSGVTNGISTTLHMEPASPRVGHTVHFSITASYPSQWCCTTTFYTGDGASVPPNLDNHACPEIHPSTFREQVEHVYNHAGTFTVEVQPSAGDFCFAPPVFINAQLYVTITVAPA